MLMAVLLRCWISSLMAKLGWEIVKKILLLHFTRNRVWLIVVFGKTTLAWPLFFTPSSNVSKFWPPSLDKAISTKPQLIGGRCVSATCHVIGVTVKPVCGLAMMLVTAKGLAPVST